LIRLTLLFLVAGVVGVPAGAAEMPTLHVGIAETDITPELDRKPVYMAGFGQNRIATGVHDPLRARAIVLREAEKKLALVSLDVVGFFLENVENIRRQLPGFMYVLVSSTHNHEGPDTLGLWGPNPFTSGVDPAYLKYIEEQAVKAVKIAETRLRPVRARLGVARAPELLHDGREPYVKTDELVALQFLDAQSGQPHGVLVQWNCHPETLASKNTELSSDFVGPAVNHLRKRFACPVIYFTGTVGGLMTSLDIDIKDEKGQVLADGTVAKTERYGRLVGDLADRALATSQPVQLTPLAAHHRSVYVPLDNKLYLLGRQLGVLKRPAFEWSGEPSKAQPVGPQTAPDRRLCCRTEVAWLRLGELDVACIPGEVYPELVLDKVQDPPDSGADFPDAPIEPAIYKQLHGRHHMLIGLANDELGYIIPKRQWDEKPPFCYGRKRPQYGEGNSCGPETAPTLCGAFKSLVDEARPLK
jgi:Neutral/alkaline non-lysosomal ceramidase, N-terminal